MKKETILNRDLYKKIKKMDRQEMENYLQSLHTEAYNAGISVMSKELAARVEAGIRNTEGIGEKRYQALIENINKELIREENQND